MPSFLQLVERISSPIKSIEIAVVHHPLWLVCKIVVFSNNTCIVVPEIDVKLPYSTCIVKVPVTDSSCEEYGCSENRRHRVVYEKRTCISELNKDICG